MLKTSGVRDSLTFFTAPALQRSVALQTRRQPLPITRCPDVTAVLNGTDTKSRITGKTITLRPRLREAFSKLIRPADRVKIAVNNWIHDTHASQNDPHVTSSQPIADQTNSQRKTASAQTTTRP
ncbi:hypothetical protein PIIN_10942 [Serendipita indica DSM 11827]|uniref:Uncharacterized protein n=1 Tax=Serendipita indica (strain DSM 11827) TaxID=1109443 RepID=G4U066_SERID|nr:hypothetical protein PIIN_10942 [Serendipita indica DSM 11827]